MKKNILLIIGLFLITPATYSVTQKTTKSISIGAPIKKAIDNATNMFPTGSPVILTNDDISSLLTALPSLATTQMSQFTKGAFLNPDTINFWNKKFTSDLGLKLSANGQQLFKTLIQNAFIIENSVLTTPTTAKQWSWSPETLVFFDLITSLLQGCQLKNSYCN